MRSRKTKTPKEIPMKTAKAKAALKKELAAEKAADRKWRAEMKARDAKDRKDHKALIAKLSKSNPFPEPIQASDFMPLGDNSKDRLSYEEQRALGINEITLGWGNSFEIWLATGFGWCCPTLHIANAKGGHKPRAYGIRLSNKGLVRIGQGPHILASQRLYLKKSNIERLKPLLDIIRGGAVAAHEKRDLLSSRRANSRSRWGF